MSVSNGLKFTNLEEVDIPTKKIMIEKSESMTEKDVDDFCNWVCQKASLLGFDVRDTTNEGRKMD